MLTLEELRAYGADVDEGMARCFQNEAFYLRLVGMGLHDANFDRLREALASQDAATAFEAAHALKGSIGNLSLTPIYRPICALAELLRGKTGAVEAGDLPGQIFAQLEKARQLEEA